MTKHCKVTISATSKTEARDLSQILLAQKLVAGIMIKSGKCMYWWKQEMVEKLYWNIEGFCVLKNKEAIINEIRIIHSDECPIIAFNEIDGNEEFLRWISDSTI